MDHAVAACLGVFCCCMAPALGHCQQCLFAWRAGLKRKGNFWLQRQFFYPLKHKWFPITMNSKYRSVVSHVHRLGEPGNRSAVHCVPFSITNRDYACSIMNLRQPFSMLNKLGQVTSSAAKPQVWAAVINTKKSRYCTTNTYLSKKTIYLLFRIYKAVAEVTECHSGSGKRQSWTQNWVTQP